MQVVHGAAITCAGERLRYRELLNTGENREVRNTQTLTAGACLETLRAPHRGS